MNQIVNKPTKGQNTLNLLMTTNPGLISKIEVANIKGRKAKV